MPHHYPKRSQYRYTKKAYRVRNWQEYETALRKRGELTLWFSEEAVRAWYAPANSAPDGQRMIIQGQESGRITALDPDKDGAILWVAQAGDEMAAANGGFGGAFDGEYYFKPLPFRDGTGAIAAIRPADGSRAWYTTLEKPGDCADSESSGCSSANWSSASAVPGAVFTGSWDGVLRSYSTEAGTILWEYPTQRKFETVNGVPGFGGAFGGGAPTIVDGMMYVGSGYAILGGAPGNVLLAFGLN